MDPCMDSMENSNPTNDDNNSEEQQSQSEGAEVGVRPTLSQVRKSWGFRRTTIAKREFMEEVGDLAHSPQILRRGRSRRTSQTPQTTMEAGPTRRAARSARSVLDDLQWSAPSSPVSEDSKPVSESSETSTVVSLDPSLWQDIGSAFHTAFSLLGGNEALSMTDAMEATDILGPANAVEASSLQAVEKTEVHDNGDDVEITQPVAPENVAGGEIHDVVLISSQEDDSDEMTLLQIKEQLISSGMQGDTSAQGGRAGRGKARGRGRGRGKGRGKGKGKGKGRGRAIGLQSIILDAEDSDDEVMLVNPAELQHLQEYKKENEKHSLELAVSPAQINFTHSPAQQGASLDCIILDSDFIQTTDISHDQYDDAPKEIVEVEKKDAENIEEYPTVSDPDPYDLNILCHICHQNSDKRFMICCDSCQEWFHGDCVGISDTQDQKLDREKQEYMCPPCAERKQSKPQSDSHPQPELDLSFPECLTTSPGQEPVRREEQQAIKETREEEEGQASMTNPKAEMETDDSIPLCMGPGCIKQPLPDSVYCGSDCIVQHAAVTMKTLTDPKEPKAKGRMQRKPAIATRPTAKAERPVRVSKRLAGKLSEDAEEEMREDVGKQQAAASPKACDPTLRDVQSTSIASSNLDTAYNDASAKAGDDCKAKSPPLSQSATEEAPPESLSEEKTKEPEGGVVQCAGSGPTTLATPSKSNHSAAQSPTILTTRQHETGALIVTKTAYVIPKKQSASQPTPSHVTVTALCNKPPSGPTLLSETRNLPVSPAPSAPSARPSQPNNQVRQSIQRSLTSILFKRICECENLEMSESEVAKLVASIEMEMFDIFRNTDSKYMNKYRTIMFNLKDPRNKGLLYRVVHGEIGPFRLVRMSQKDMQATKAPEPSGKETAQVKDGLAKVTTVQKPESVKVDLPSLNPARPGRKPDSMEQKKSLPPPPKARANQPNQNSAVPDILSCMLKDTTSEHKAHLFDLKCKICTGQILASEMEEPSKKKAKTFVSRDKHEPSWKKYAADSPLQAPPEPPDMDSPASPLLEPPSHLIMDPPKSTDVESPASPTMDSPTSPTLESPASPIMESPASPTPDTPGTTPPKRTYTPVMIPAVSTVTITRRDPRTAANRMSASSSYTSDPSSTVHNQAAPYATLKETTASQSAPQSSLPPPKTVPKSILMKPSSTADPRLYGSSSRNMALQPPADGDTVQFLAKQDILWKGFLNMITVAKFVTKGYLVSGSAENLKADLPDTIQIGGRILPETVWDYVDKLKTSVTKELCVIRFHPATEEEEVAYVSLFSYFSSRGRFGVVANIGRSIKDVYLVPLSAKESIPSILQPLEGPGLEKNRPNLLLGLAIVQKGKRPGTFPQEIEEKRPKVSMSKDPLWIPKPPVLYGSDKLEIFQPYDPETPASTTPPSTASCPGSPSDSTPGSVPSLSTSIKTSLAVSSVAATESISKSNSDKNPTPPTGEKTPLQAIFKTLFGSKQSDTMVSSDGSSRKTGASTKKIPVFSQVSSSIVDPIVQQYGQKSKVKEIENEENDFDRPYDPEEEYDPALGFNAVTPQITKQHKIRSSTLAGFVEDDVAYDPEDETIFEDIRSDTAVTNPPLPTQVSDSSSCSTPVSTSTPPQSCSEVATVMSNLPTGTVVVSAATLSEQQRMLEELNKQIEEQKRQLKEQEEALRQQREAVGMFMAHFSVSDSLMSPPTKALPHSQLPPGQCGTMQTESMPSDKTDKVNNLTETKDNSNVDLETAKPEGTTASHNVINDASTVEGQDETQKKVEEHDKYSSAGEIEDSDVAYDPEDESLFDEIQEDVFKVESTKASESSFRALHSASHKRGSPNSYHSRKRKSSPKRRSRRERDSHRSPSRRTQHRSRSHSRRHRDRDRHRRSERDRSRHRARDPSERQGHHRKDHSTRLHSRGHRRSSSSPGKKHSVSLSPKQQRGPFPQVTEKTNQESVPCNAPDSTVRTVVESKTSFFTTVAIKNDPDGPKSDCNYAENSEQHSLKVTVKTEISEPPELQNIERKSVNDDDDSVSKSSTQMTKLSLQDAFFHDKCENPIPLREIDPPLRDSPESPDPEPQFLKASNIEKDDAAETEINKDHEEHTSDPIPVVKCENNYLPFGDQAAMSSRTADQGGIERDSQMLAGITGLKHLEIIFPGGGHSSLLKSLDILGQGPEMDPILMRSGSNMGYPELMREPSKQNERGSLSMKGPLSNKKGLDTAPSGSRGCLSDVSHIKTDTGGHVESRYDSHLQKGLPCSNVEDFRSQPENPDNKTGVMTIGMSFGGPELEKNIPHANALISHMSGGDETDLKPSFMSMMGDAQKSEDIPKITNTNWINPGTILSSQNKELGLQMRNPEWNTLKSENVVPEPVRQGTFTPDDWSGNKSDWEYLKMENRAPERGDVVNSEYRQPESEIRIEHDLRHNSKGAGGPDFMGPRHGGRGRQMQFPRHDIRGVVDPHFMGERPERPVHEMELSVHDRKGPVHSEFKRREYEMRGPEMEVPLHDRRGPWGPDVVGPGSERRGPNIIEGTGLREPCGLDSIEPAFDRRCLGMGGPGPDRIGPVGPHCIESRSERKDLALEACGTDMGGSSCPGYGETWPERRIPDRVGPGLKWRDPSQEVPGTDRRGGPDFRAVGPESLGLSMEGPENYRKGDLEFTGPGHERRNLTMEGPGSQSRGGGGPVFRGPGPENRCLSREGPGPDRIGQRVPDFREPGPDNRGSAVAGPRIERIKLGDADFNRPVNEMRGPSVNSHYPQKKGPRGPEVWVPGSERRGPGDQNAGGQGSERRGPYAESTESNFMRQESELIDQGGPHGMEDVYQNTEGPRHNRTWTDFRRSASDMVGPLVNRRGPGGQRMGRPGPQQALNIENPGPIRRGPECSDIIEFGPQRISPNVDEMADSKHFPRGTHFRGPDSEIISEDMEDPQFDKRGAHFRGRGLTKSIIGGQWGFRGRGNFRGPSNESRNPNIDGPVPDRPKPRDFRKPWLERPCPDIEEPEPDWKGSDISDFRGPGIRQQEGNMEGLRHERENDWGVSESVQEIQDLEVQESNRTVNNFRAPGPMRRNIRKPGPYGPGSAPGTSNTDPEDQWSGRREDGPVEHRHEHCRQGPHSEWRDSERQKVQYPGDIRGPMDDPGCMHPVPFQDNSERISPGPRGRGQGMEWKDRDKGVSGPFFRGERNPDSRGQNYDRGRGRGRGRGQGTGMHQTMDGPGDHRRGPDSINSYPNRRELNTECFDRRGPIGPDLRHMGPGYRNSHTEGPGSDGVDIEDPGSNRQGFEPDFRRHLRSPKMKWQDPCKADMRGTSPKSSDFIHGPGRWDSNKEFPESDRRRQDMGDGEHGQRDQTNRSERRSPHQVSRFQGFPETNSPFNRSRGPGPNSGEKSFPAFEGPQNQQSVPPQRHRGALLPTPTEGPLPFPNHMIKSHNVFSMKEKQVDHSAIREPRGGRAMLHRGHARGKRRGPVSSSVVGGDGGKNDDF